MNKDWPIWRFNQKFNDHSPLFLLHHLLFDFSCLQVGNCRLLSSTSGTVNMQWACFMDSTKTGMASSSKRRIEWNSFKCRATVDFWVDEFIDPSAPMSVRQFQYIGWRNGDTASVSAVGRSASVLGHPSIHIRSTTTDGGGECRTRNVKLLI